MSGDRIERLYRAMREAEQNNHLDAVALNPGPTLTYLTGLTFHLMERPSGAACRPWARPRR